MNVQARVLPAIDVTGWSANLLADPEFRLIARWSHFALRLVAGADALDLRVSPGGLSLVRTPAPSTDDETIVLEGSDAAWRAFLAPEPVAPDHSVLGMDRRRDDFTIAQGRETMIRNLRTFALVMTVLRQTFNANGPERTG